jgi:uncharacterized DUF497 family protein
VNLKFEWNKSKAKDNFTEHGISFELAERVLDDPFAVEFLDDREDYDEERFVILGIVDRQILFVAYAERKDAVRIISARRATKYEQKIYNEENS